MFVALAVFMVGSLLTWFAPMAKRIAARAFWGLAAAVS